MKTLDFSAFSWYNLPMKNSSFIDTSNTEMVTISRAEYDNMQAQISWLMEQLRLSKKKQFGVSSEKSAEELLNQLSLFFNEAEMICAAEAKEKDTTNVSGHTRKKRGGNVKEILPEGIPETVIEHGLSEEERICPNCNEQMEIIGKEEQWKLKIIPAQASLEHHIYYTYACKECKTNGTEVPVLNTPLEPAVIPGSYATPEAIAHFMVQKFVMGSPLYRQEQEWNRAGVMLSRQTMSNWLLRASDDWLKPVYNALHQQLLQQKVLHADETTLQVLHEDGKKAQSKSYMWLYRTSGDTESPIVLYDYQPNRKAENAEQFLDGFSGYLHADGYPGYHRLREDIRVVGCWAHARRKFDEAVNALPEKDRAGSAALEGQYLCSQLFAIEKNLAALSPEERYNERLKQAKPVLDALQSWSEKKNVAPKSALGRALYYLHEQWPYLIRYLEDGRLEISNNRGERSIKPFVIGRKNFLFANTPAGAQSSAVIYSLVETAKENGLDPFRYLCWIMKSAPAMAISDADWASKLVPSNAPQDVRAKQTE